MFLVGYFVLFWGVSKRFERMENRANQLELTERKRSHAKEWGFPQEEIDRLYALKVTKENGRKEIAKFESTCRNLHILGWLLLIIAIAMLFGEDLNHYELGNIVAILGVFVLLGINVLQTDKRFDKLDMEIAWLNHMLKVINDHSENIKTALVDRNLKMADRLNKVEKRI
jgi:hypothetical protein